MDTSPAVRGQTSPRVLSTHGLYPGHVSGGKTSSCLVFLCHVADKNQQHREEILLLIAQNNNDYRPKHEHFTFFCSFQVNWRSCCHFCPVKPDLSTSFLPWSWTRTVQSVFLSSSLLHVPDWLKPDSFIWPLNNQTRHLCWTQSGSGPGKREKSHKWDYVPTETRATEQ